MITHKYYNYRVISLKFIDFTRGIFIGGVLQICLGLLCKLRFSLLMNCLSFILSCNVLCFCFMPFGTKYKNVYVGLWNDCVIFIVFLFCDCFYTIKSFNFTQKNTLYTNVFFQMSCLTRANSSFTNILFQELINY